jgi:DNA-binding response OmpR family regulator
LQSDLLLQYVENIIQILVVDDDPVTCTRLKGYFSTEGYDMFVAHNGQDMWDVLNRQAIAVVLLEVGLPGKDGLELARELRAHSDELGIILVSGRSDDVDKIVGLESGANDYVTKPFNSRELLARVKIVLRGSRRKQGATTQPCSLFRALEFRHPAASPDRPGWPHGGADAG